MLAAGPITHQFVGKHQIYEQQSKSEVKVPEGSALSLSLSHICACTHTCTHKASPQANFGKNY